jgi:hypothetical protein
MAVRRAAAGRAQRYHLCRSGASLRRINIDFATPSFIAPDAHPA